MPSLEQTQPSSVRRRRHSAPAGAPAAAILTGPGEDGKRFPSPGAALSAALTRACAASEPCTFYVRDADGLTLFYVERREGRCNVQVVTVNNPHTRETQQ